MQGRVKRNLRAWIHDTYAHNEERAQWLERLVEPVTVDDERAFDDEDLAETISRVRYSFALILMRIAHNRVKRKDSIMYYASDIYDSLTCIQHLMNEYTLNNK